MRVLMLSTDPAAEMPGSDTAKRLEEYAKVLGEIRIITPERTGNFVFRWFGTFRKLRSALRESGYDVITVQAPDEWGLIGFLAARYFGIPLQVQIHTDIMSPWYRRASWKERARYRIARFLIPRARCIRVVSRRIERSLLQANLTTKCSKISLQQDQKVTVLPIFTDVSKYLNAAIDSKMEGRLRYYTFKMIAVGRFVDKEKNFSMLIEVMREFVKICPKALLVIVGDGPDRENYQLSIINYQLEKNIILEPWRDDLPSFYKSFDLFLSPSNYEGWGRAVLEAMAAGLPVLMTDTGLAGEVVENGKNGVIVPVGNPAAFLEELKKLYNDTWMRNLLKERGRERAKTLEPRSKEEHLRLYRESFDLSSK